MRVWLTAMTICGLLATEAQAAMPNGSGDTWQYRQPVPINGPLCHRSAWVPPPPPPPPPAPRVTYVPPTPPPVRPVPQPLPVRPQGGVFQRLQEGLFGARGGEPMAAGALNGTDIGSISDNMSSRSFPLAGMFSNFASGGGSDQLALPGLDVGDRAPAAPTGALAGAATTERSAALDSRSAPLATVPAGTTEAYDHFADRRSFSEPSDAAAAPAPEIHVPDGPVAATPPLPTMAMPAQPSRAVSPLGGDYGGDYARRSSPALPRPVPPQLAQWQRLTAGDHDDLLNPQLYARYVDGFLARDTLAGVPRVDTRNVLTVAVSDPDGNPLPFAQVTLTCADGNSLALPTLADGTVAFFPDLDNLGSTVTMTASAPGGAHSMSRRVDLGDSGGQRQQVVLQEFSHGVQQFDLALTVDTTGSMSDEIAYLKAELVNIVGGLRASHPGLDVRVALVAYRDKGDLYITRVFPFTRNMSELQDRLGELQASGGGDYPEAVERALADTVALDWRSDAVKSMLLVGDAPPHAEDVAASWTSVEAARDRRIQIVPVGASGVGPGAEYLMRAMAAVTQSRYVFLTDDSGIGNAHAEPSVDCYRVTLLNNLVRNVLDAQLSGRRIEPQDGEIVRTVGNYDNGRCILPSGFVQSSYR